MLAQSLPKCLCRKVSQRTPRACIGVAITISTRQRIAVRHRLQQFLHHLPFKFVRTLCGTPPPPASTCTPFPLISRSRLQAFCSLLATPVPCLLVPSSPCSLFL